ncbi:MULTISPECIES: acyltransferase family protein [Micrococcaceae]|uniref:acyltransferase family protein n=1 Tax=Micrococcaceae TaxID=1268 RepID=UPI00070089DA|nr:MULTISPECIES: acyltransferase [unclassified Arthrobacter]KRE71896.1 acyltransferase [Arthrobacter sp. Soil761]TWD47113.1 acyltransferase-like protein [Arthrobacter sp. AG367]
MGSAGTRGTVTGTDTADRDPAIDLVRLVCLVLVVVGHSMMVSPVLHPDGTVTTENTLAEQDWFEPVIWIFMVMPLFFVTGGITGLQSWRRLKAGGGTAAQFIRARLLRLLRPATALLATMVAGLSAAAALGVDRQVVQLVATGAGMPLWFLAAYLAAQLNIPVLAALHHRAPWLTLALLAGLVVAVDCFRGALPDLANVNLVFVWCAVQQLGFLAADGYLAPLSRSGLVGVAVAAHLLLGLVTGLGLYRGNMLVNLNPPNLTLVILGVSQLAVMELARPVLAPLAGIRWIARLLQLAGARSLTVYLWHLPLLGAMSGLLLLTPVPKPSSGTAGWWWSRPLVVLALVLLLLPATAAFGRLEERTTAPQAFRCRPAAAGAAVVVVFIPVADAALNGLSLGLLAAGTVCFAVAILLLGGLPLRRRRAVPGGRKRGPGKRGPRGIASGVK